MRDRGKLWNFAASGIVAVMAVSFSGAGCSATHYAVFRDVNLDQDSHDAHALLIDAQQRAILTSPVSHPSANDGSLAMYCAEPSPDALVALSSALAASGSGTIYGKATFQGQVQQAMSEAATQLGRRSQSIQLLRDAGYRLCEARMDGFITNGTFPVALNRLQDAMVTLLAIEQLTSPNENQAPVTITAPSIAGDLNIGAPSSQSSAAPSKATTKTTATKTPTPTSTPTTATSYKSNDAVDSVPELANSGPDQNRDRVGNAPDVGFVKVASGPTPTATPTRTSTPTPSPKRTSTRTPTSTATHSPTPSATPTPSSSEAISPAVAQAVEHMVSIYQYKNLEEFCLTVGAAELQANFQVASKFLSEHDNDSDTENNLNKLLAIEKDAHIWHYCQTIFDKYKQLEAAQAPKASPTPSATPTPGTGQRRKTTPKAAATAAGFIAS